MRAFLLIAAAAAALAGPALAAPAALRADITDADGRVTLGDIFEDAGKAADVLVAVRTTASVVIDAASVQAVAHRNGLDWANPQGLRRVIIRAGAGEAAAAQASATQAARGNVQVLAWARNIMAGEVIQASDLIWSKAAAAPVDAPSDPDAMVGMSARRALREGGLAAARDVAAPMVIKAGDTVDVVWSDGAISLSLQGKAMSAAAAGEPFKVQNLSSKKIVDAVAAGPGQAVAGPAAAQMRGRRPALTFAAR